MNYDELFGALSDATRRTILEYLVERDGATAGQLAELFPDISRPAVSRHLRVLRESGFVLETKQGREVHYHMRWDVLDEVDAWLQRFWRRKLLALKEVVENEIPEES